MPRPRHPLTPEIQDKIASYIRAGGFPHVAATAAGVPAEVFERWLRLGQRRSAPQKYYAFREAVLQAQAQARLKAESDAFGGKPMDWLRSGPGRETAARAGWSSAPRPRAGTKDDDNPFLDPRVLAFFRVLLEALAPYPEARAAAAATIMTCTEGMSPEEKAEWRHGLGGLKL